ncbi:MAG TPA: S8 family serine peptidase [Polyangiaceae bacterium]|nr:S8 family serine peptidase [Polyangiaceae bacterium]
MTIVPRGAVRVQPLPLPTRALRLASGIGIAPLDEQTLSGLTRADPGWIWSWAPPRHLLLDVATATTAVQAYRQEGGGSGQGVWIGVVDTGLDVSHPDLRTASGATRVRWWIDFTRLPAGLQPELESRFGCGAEAPCAIFSNHDIDILLNNGVSNDEPTDLLGHGTHVAAVAASNGLALGKSYLGVAPEADLVVAKVTSYGEAILDPTVLRAVDFLFDRAESAGAACVINLSLGSDMGAHDGSSALERGLSSYVGAQHPGRAIVVAAGNSGGVYSGVTSAYPGPFGVHTEVHVPAMSPTRVPLVWQKPRKAGLTGAIDAYVAFRAPDRVRVGVERNGQLLGDMVDVGRARSFGDAELNVLILNGVGAFEADSIAANTAIVTLDGTWPATDSLKLRFEGNGTASVWVQGSGDLDPNKSIGVVVPFAQKEGTINVPASAPDLIAVGATTSRSNWTSIDGTPVTLPSNSPLARAAFDSAAFFSSAGPSATGTIKPDIVAPGVNLIAAMSRSADPRLNESSVFSGQGLCEPVATCLITDEYHAVSSGTSVSTPLVTGAIALLFERRPSLTQNELRNLLQAGARRLSGGALNLAQVGPGGLDVVRTAQALELAASHGSSVPSDRSWLVFPSDYVRPDLSWPSCGTAQLRDGDGNLADGFDELELRLEVSGGVLQAPLVRSAPGLYRFCVASSAGHGGEDLMVHLWFGDEAIAHRVLRVSVDRGAAAGTATPRGGACGLGRPASPDALVFALWMGGLAAARRRRQTSVRLQEQTCDAGDETGR